MKDTKCGDILDFIERKSRQLRKLYTPDTHGIIPAHNGHMKEAKVLSLLIQRLIKDIAHVRNHPKLLTGKARKKFRRGIKKLQCKLQFVFLFFWSRIFSER
jgi:hypothetical protein